MTIRSRRHARIRVHGQGPLERVQDARLMTCPRAAAELVAIAGRDEEAVAEAARRYGFAEHVTDWHALISDERVQLFDNSGPNNLHAEPTIAAAEAGKHVICEKPLGRDAAESYETWQRVAATGVKHMCAFNYRFGPAVRLARQIIEAGEIGEITHFRAPTCRSGATDDAVWRFDKLRRAWRARDLGAHVSTWPLPGRRDPSSWRDGDFQAGREVDDAVESVVSFESGGVGTIEATRFATGRKTPSAGDQRSKARSPSTSSGSTSCSHVAGRRRRSRGRLQDGAGLRGRPPFWEPGGRTATSSDGSTPSSTSCTSADGDPRRRRRRAARATLEDGYRAAEVCDAMLRSAEGGGRESVTYR